MSRARNSARRTPKSEREPGPVSIFTSFHTKPHGDTSPLIRGDRSLRRSRSHRDRSLRRSRCHRDQSPVREGSSMSASQLPWRESRLDREWQRDSRSNPIRIKRSRTPLPPLKFDPQCFQQFTNSPFNRCDRSPMFSGDYKLRGEGGAVPRYGPGGSLTL